MTTDTENPTGESVQEEQASSEEQASKTEQTSIVEDVAGTGEEQTPEQKMAALIQQEVGKAVKQAVDAVKEAGRRELQSQQDKNKAVEAAAERRAKVAESTVDALKAKYRVDDPDTLKEIELLELKNKSVVETAGQKEEATLKAQQEYANKLESSLTAHLEALGIDPKDERIDWAKDAQEFIEGRTRFDASVAKILTEEKRTMQEGFDKRLKALEDKSKAEDTEANSVDTTASLGAVNASDAEFMAKMGSGDLPLTEENLKRLDEIKAKVY
jgi:hypothetical protein